MIGSFILFFAGYVLQLLTAILPSSSGLPADVSSALSDFGGYVGILDPILPIGTLATVFALVVAYELAVFCFKTVRWVVGYIPFIGKGS